MKGRGDRRQRRQGALNRRIVDMHLYLEWCKNPEKFPFGQLPNAQTLLKTAYRDVVRTAENLKTSDGLNSQMKSEIEKLIKEKK